MVENKAVVALWRRTYFWMFAVAVILLLVVFFMGEQEKTKVAKIVSLQVAVIRDLASGKPVSMIDLENAFTEVDTAVRKRAAMQAASDLGLPYEDIRLMMDRMNLSVVYTGSPDKIPGRLRSATQPGSEGLIRVDVAAAK